MFRTLKPQRALYIPKGAARVVPKTGGCEFWLYERDPGKFHALCFIGKAQKPSWHYSFRSAEKRAEYMARQLDGLAARAKAKAERAEKRNAPHRLDVGVILVASWGYEQTNVDFYEVVSKIGATMVEIEKIGHQRATDSVDGSHGMSCHVVPDTTHRTGERRRCRVTYGASVSLSSYSSAHIWDGRPRYCSWYG